MVVPIGSGARHPRRWLNAVTPRIGPRAANSRASRAATRVFPVPGGPWMARTPSYAVVAPRTARAPEQAPAIRSCSRVTMSCSSKLDGREHIPDTGPGGGPVTATSTGCRGGAVDAEDRLPARRSAVSLSQRTKLIRPCDQRTRRSPNLNTLASCADGDRGDRSPPAATRATGTSDRLAGVSHGRPRAAPATVGHGGSRRRNVPRTPPRSRWARGGTTPVATGVHRKRPVCGPRMVPSSSRRVATRSSAGSRCGGVALVAA